MWFTTVRSPNRLVIPFTSMARSSAITPSRTDLHVHRLAGMQLLSNLRIKHHLDHEHELAAALAAVDHRGGELRLRCDETHLPDEGFLHTVHDHFRALPHADRAHFCLRHEGSHLDILRW